MPSDEQVQETRQDDHKGPPNHSPTTLVPTPPSPSQAASYYNLPLKVLVGVLLRFSGFIPTSYYVFAVVFGLITLAGFAWLWVQQHHSSQ